MVNYLRLHRANSQAEVREGDVEETAKFVITSKLFRSSVDCDWVDSHVCFRSKKIISSTR